MTCHEKLHRCTYFDTAHSSTARRHTHCLPSLILVVPSDIGEFPVLTAPFVHAC